VQRDVEFQLATQRNRTIAHSITQPCLVVRLPRLGYELPIITRARDGCSKGVRTAQLEHPVAKSGHRRVIRRAEVQRRPFRRAVQITENLRAPLEAPPPFTFALTPLPVNPLRHSAVGLRSRRLEVRALSGILTTNLVVTPDAASRTACGVSLCARNSRRRRVVRQTLFPTLPPTSGYFLTASR